VSLKEEYFEFDGDAVVDTVEEDVFVTADGDGFKFGGRRNFEETLEFGTLFQRKRVDLDSDIYKF
jgi:hypothetical protein